VGALWRSWATLGNPASAEISRPVDRWEVSLSLFPCVRPGATVLREWQAAAEETELRRLADLVDARLRSMTAPGRPISPQALLLAAISLTHDLEEEKRKRLQLETRSKEMLRSVLARIDAAIEASDEKPDSDADASEPPPPVELMSDEFER
jgi:cell division protein ZapA